VAFSSLPFILISGFLSVLMGMVGALTQTGLKRFLSYSGVGHMGFLLLGVYSEASLFYLLLYIAVTVVAWGLLSEVRRLEPLSSDPLKYLSDLSGMVHRHRGVAVLFSISMFSMAGVPPLAGFFAKLQVLFSLLDDSVVLALGAILISVISTFYYLRLSKRMVFEDVDGASVVSVMSWHIPLILSSLLLSFFMIQPESLMILSSVLSKALISGTPI
jgi:NADH-quinone oxidoreductase subunit N